MQALLSFVGSGIVFLIWNHNHLWGIRVFGIFSGLWGAYWLFDGRIPFLFNQRHVGDISGIAAVVISLVTVGFGALLVVTPELIVSHFDPIVEYAPWRR